MLKRLLLILTLFCAVGLTFAQEIPEKPTSSPVVDFTNTLSADQQQQLDQKIRAFEDSSSTQIAVVLIKSVGDYDIAEYATKLGRAWGVGQKDKNNGVVLLIAVNDRKLTMQTGYGVEGALPDITTQEIIRNDITPRFKEGDYYAGIDAGVDQIIKYTKGEYKVSKKSQSRRAKGDGGGGSAIVIIIIVFVIIFIIKGRGGRGGGGQIMGRRGSASPFWWFLAGNMLGGSGRSSGGSSWGGGGSSGGGWGGFGGGSFGGGGSSGSW